jgi:hypothetical protein
MERSVANNVSIILTSHIMKTKIPGMIMLNRSFFLKKATSSDITELFLDIFFQSLPGKTIPAACLILSSVLIKSMLKERGTTELSFMPTSIHLITSSASQ